MQTEVLTQHQWLEQLVGEWTFEGTCPGGPNEGPQSFGGTETYRKLGDLWVLGEGSGTTPDGQPSVSVTTLGFDPAKNTFVGSFVCTVMTHLWIYDRGTLSEDGKALTLECDGPDFMANDGSMARYKDVIAFESDSHRTLTAFIHTAEGEWSQLMQSHYHRKA